MEASAKVMGSDEDVVGATAAIPKGEVGGDEINGGRNESTSMANSREAINCAKITGNINWNKEEISFIWVKCAHITF